MTPQILVIWISTLFAVFVIGAVALFIIDIFYRSDADTTGIFTNQSYAANATLKMGEGIYNIFDQMPNVGKLAGVSLIVGVMGLLGVGGYMGYQKYVR